MAATGAGSGTTPPWFGLVPLDAAAQLAEALTDPIQAGIEVAAVLTDNGSCYHSHAFVRALGDAKHRRTRPYRPQTNGKDRALPPHARC